MREGDRFLRVGQDTVRWRIDGEPGAPRMLLYNGLVSDALHWRFWIEHYARRFSVISWDYRGHGPYDVPRELDAVSIEGFARDGAAVLAAAGGGPAILAGISMGVQAALEHARQRPGDVRGLALLCGTYGHPLDRLGAGPGGRRAAATAARMLFAVAPLARGLMTPLIATGIAREMAFLTGGARRDSLPRGILDELFAHVRRMHPRVIGTIFASWVHHSAEEALPEIAAPAIIFAGGMDQLTPPALAEVMASRMPRATLRVVPGHSHLLQLERPELVHREVDGWLQSLDG